MFIPLTFSANLLILVVRRRQINSKPDADFATRQFYKDVGALVREARKKAKGISQESLANSVGLTRTSLTNIEKGRQKLLLHTFIEIAASVGANPADLLPKRSNVLDGLKVDLTSLPSEERGFIERAAGAGTTYATHQEKNNHNDGQHAPRTKRRNRSSD